MNLNNWEEIKERYRALWSISNETPLVHIKGVADSYIPDEIAIPETLEQQWLDAEYVLASSRNKIRGTYYAGDAFPLIMPNLGPDLLGAMLGCDLIFGETTSWSVPCMSEDEWGARHFIFEESNVWWKQVYNLTEYLASESRGEFFVGFSDYHPGCDALVALRGPEAFCIDLLNHQKEILQATKEIFEVFRQVVDRTHSMLSKYQEGSATWMPIWHPGKWYVTSCDLICMISPEMFETFVAGELDKELEYLDASIFHLDGPAAIHTHLDRLISFPKLNGVQLQYGAGGGTAKDWITAAKKIQDSGKIVEITTAPEHISDILENLKPQGLFIHVHPEPNNGTAKPFTQDEVDSIMKKWFNK